MDNLYEHAESCFAYLESLQPLASQIQLDGAKILHCYTFTQSIHAQPWLLGGVPYPLIKAGAELFAFHGVMLLLSRMFTLGM
jgi:hypothetical protein